MGNLSSFVSESGLLGGPVAIPLGTVLLLSCSVAHRPRIDLANMSEGPDHHHVYLMQCDLNA